MASENKVTTEYALATPVKGEDPTVEGIYSTRTGKQGHICCGGCGNKNGCCDTRRAVIIVDIINATFLTMGFMSLIFVAAYNGGNIDDDEVEEAMTSLDNVGVGLLIGIVFIKLVFSLVGVYGAISYNIYMVGATCVVYVLEALFALFTLDLGALVYSALFAYPHVFFIREVRAGIMTKENYPINEEHSCCCV